MNLDQFKVAPPSVDWITLLPVILVASTGLVALLIEMFRPKQTNVAIIWTSLIGLGVAAGSLILQMGQPSGDTFAGMALRDPASLVLQLVLVGVCFFTFFFSESYLRERRIPFGEFYPLALWSTAGGMIMVSTENLLMLFIGLEVLSISLYVMAGMARQESKSEESAIKYFLLGAFASAFLLYGIALVYGATGSLHLDQIARAYALNDGLTEKLLIFGVGFMLVGLGFKAALVPFHQWAPDVYQGAPTNVTGFMAAAAKVAAIGALYRVLSGAVDLSGTWMPLLIIIAILTMTIPNLIACQQKNVKRILGYSSIANAGYILVGLLAHLQSPEKIGIETTVFFLVSYALVTIGMFALLTLNARDGKEGTELSDFYGLWSRHPLAAGLMVLFVASLIGIPITGGFFAKLGIFNDAVNAGLTLLAIVLAINSAISCYYYLGIVRAAFVAEETRPQPLGSTMPPGLRFTGIACAVGVLGISFFLTPIQAYLSGKDPNAWTNPPATASAGPSEDLSSSPTDLDPDSDQDPALTNPGEAPADQPPVAEPDEQSPPESPGESAGESEGTSPAANPAPSR